MSDLPFNNDAILPATRVPEQPVQEVLDRARELLKAFVDRFEAVEKSLVGAKTLGLVEKVVDLADGPAKDSQYPNEYANWWSLEVPGHSIDPIYGLLTPNSVSKTIYELDVEYLAAMPASGNIGGWEEQFHFVAKAVQKGTDVEMQAPWVLTQRDGVEEWVLGFQVTIDRSPLDKQIPEEVYASWLGSAAASCKHGLEENASRKHWGCIDRLVYQITSQDLNNDTIEGSATSETGVVLKAYSKRGTEFVEI